MNKREVRSTPHTIQKRKQSLGVINDLDNVDFVPSNVNSSHRGALFHLCPSGFPKSLTCCRFAMTTDSLNFVRKCAMFKWSLLVLALVVGELLRTLSSFIVETFTFCP